MRINQISLLISVWLMTGCYVQKPLQEVTFQDALGLTQEENLSNQLADLKQGDKLEVLLKSGEELSLMHNFISHDTLVAIQNLPKNSSQIKVALSEIQSVEVRKINTPLTLGIVTIAVLGVLLLISSFNGINYTW